MERIHLDFLGPLPMSKKKNLLILIMIDRFTKWVECIPLSNQTVESTVKAANEFFLDLVFLSQFLQIEETYLKVLF